MDAGALRLSGGEVVYLVVLGAVIWEGVLVVVGLVGGLEEGLVEDLGVYPVEVQEAEVEALDPSCLQAYQEASRMEEHLVVGREVGPRVDQVASLEELGVDPEVEAQSSVGLASVAALAVPLAQQVVADADSV